MRRNLMMDYMMSRNNDMRMSSHRDMARRRRDRGMDYDMEHNYRRRDMHEDYPEDSRYDSARGRNDYERRREYYGSYGNVPFRMTSEEDYARRGRRRDYGNYDYGDDYGYDYNYGNDYGPDRLSRKEINHWVEKLMKELNQDEKEMFKMDKVIKKAEEMGIKFDKFTEDELYVATLMRYTDDKDVLGKSNLDTYIALGKTWLCDEDAGVRYGEKLAAYFDNIVMG